MSIPKASILRQYRKIHRKARKKGPGGRIGRRIRNRIEELAQEGIAKGITGEPELEGYIQAEMSKERDWEGFKAFIEWFIKEIVPILISMFVMI